MKFAISLLLVCCQAAVLQAAARKPPLAKSEFLVTDWYGFLIERGETGIDYALSFTVAKPEATPLYLRTIFENPQGGHHLVVDSEIKRGDTKVRVRSEAVPDLHDDRVYKIKVLIFDSPDRKHQIGEHLQYVRFISPFGPSQTRQPAAGSGIKHS